jgi:hypothetical protein
VIIEVNNTRRNHRDRQPPIKINQNNMPVVEKSAHLGILRCKSKEKTEAHQGYVIRTCNSINS